MYEAGQEGLALPQPASVGTGQSFTLQSRDDLPIWLISLHNHRTPDGQNFPLAICFALYDLMKLRASKIL